MKKLIISLSKPVLVAALFHAWSPAQAAVTTFDALNKYYAELQTTEGDITPIKTFFDRTLYSDQTAGNRLPFSGEEAQATWRIVLNASRYLARQEDYLDDRKDELSTANLEAIKQRRADMQTALLLANLRLFFAADDPSERCLRIRSASQLTEQLKAASVVTRNDELAKAQERALSHGFVKNELTNQTACKFTERKSQSAEKEEIENSVFDQLKSQVAAALRLVNDAMSDKVEDFKSLLDRAQKSIPSRTKEVLELQDSVEAANSNAELVRNDSFDLEGKLRKLTAPKDKDKPDVIDLTQPGTRIEAEIKRVVKEGPGEVKRAQSKLRESFEGYFEFIRDTLEYLAAQRSSVCAPTDDACLSACQVLKKTYLDTGKLQTVLAPFDGTPVSVAADPITVLGEVSKVYESCLADFRARISQELPKTDRELIQENFAKEFGAISSGIIK